MRKLYFLMLLLTTFAGFAFAPPVINTPGPLTPCDAGSDGTEVVDLTQVIPEVLGALNPSLYTLTFHTSLTDANGDINPIPNPSAYLAVSGAHYIRVEENADTTNFSTTTLQIMLTMLPTAAINGPTTVCGGDEITIAFQGSGGGEPFTFAYAVNGGPVLTAVTPFDLNGVGINLPSIESGTYDINLISVTTAAGCINIINFLHHIDVFPVPTPLEPLDLSIEQIPFTGTAVFDLTSNDGLLVNSATNVSAAYYPSLVNAQNGTNEISTPSAFIGSNGQQIGVRVTNAGTGCSTIKSFYLYITNPDIVYIPDPIFKNHLLTHNPTIDFNGNNEIEYTEAEAYSNILLISEMNINDLTGIEAFINLTQLHCYNNNLTSLDLAGLTNLNTLYCYGNQLTSLNLEGDYNLVILDCYDNQLTSLNVSGLSNLYELFCNDNQLTTLELSGTTNLGDFSCQNNQLTTLDVSNSTNLISLGCAGNPITALDVSNLVNLQYLYCYDNLLSTLDVTDNTALITLVFNDNPNLTSVYIKNGANEAINLSNNPSLEFICADDTQIGNVQQLLATAGMNAIVNSYCSFTPGGNYNTITGIITFDDDNNGCDATDSTPSNIKVKLASPIDSGATFTNASGNYTFYTDAGGFNWLPDIENPTWFTISPTTGNTLFADDNNNTSTQNFCITANGIHPDLEIIIAPITPARPGFDARYQIVYKNKGNQTITQTGDGVSFTYDHNRMSLVEVSEPVSLLIGPPGTLNWDVINLLPFESRSIYITLNTNPPTDIDYPVNIGDVLNFTATVNPIAGDEIPSDNVFQFNQTVVGSFDPNDVTCIEGTLVSPSEIGNYLRYVINFENTGTADAENIVVRDIIDTDQYDIDSFQLLNSSAPVTARLTGNVAEFIFPNINLQSGGHGNILIKIKSKDTLVQGDSVSKKASIYFDYNAPVDTNLENTIFQALNNPDNPLDASISVYPNPTKGNIHINCNNKIQSVQMFDVQGRLLQTNLVNENQTTIDVSAQSNGVYFLKIVSEKGTGIKKIVRE